jgi:hypothetical protein
MSLLSGGLPPRGDKDAEEFFGEDDGFVKEANSQDERLKAPRRPAYGGASSG